MTMDLCLLGAEWTLTETDRARMSAYVNGCKPSGLWGKKKMFLLLYMEELHAPQKPLPSLPWPQDLTLE